MISTLYARLLKKNTLHHSIAIREVTASPSYNLALLLCSLFIISARSGSLDAQKDFDVIVIESSLFYSRDFLVPTTD